VLQVSVAALLDNFISASSEMEMEEKLLQSKAYVRDRLERNPMEPLLIKLARDFTDSQDLSERLLKLYKVRQKYHHSMIHKSKLLRLPAPFHFVSGI
jgi:hypothetical protein